MTRSSSRAGCSKLKRDTEAALALSPGERVHSRPRKGLPKSRQLVLTLTVGGRGAEEQPAPNQTRHLPPSAREARLPRDRARDAPSCHRPPLICMLEQPPREPPAHNPPARSAPAFAPWLTATSPPHPGRRSPAQPKLSREACPRLTLTCAALPWDPGAGRVQDTLIKAEKYATGDLGPLATSAAAPRARRGRTFAVPTQRLDKNTAPTSRRSALPRLRMLLELGLILHRGVSSVPGAGHGPAPPSACAGRGPLHSGGDDGLACTGDPQRRHTLLWHSCEDTQRNRQDSGSAARS